MVVPGVGLNPGADFKNVACAVVLASKLLLVLVQMLLVRITVLAGKVTLPAELTMPNMCVDPVATLGTVVPLI